MIQLMLLGILIALVVIAFDVRMLTRLVGRQVR